MKSSFKTAFCVFLGYLCPILKLKFDYMKNFSVTDIKCRTNLAFPYISSHPALTSTATFLLNFTPLPALVTTFTHINHFNTSSRSSITNYTMNTSIKLFNILVFVQSCFCSLYVVNFPLIRSLLAHLQEIVPSIET